MIDYECYKAEDETKLDTVQCAKIALRNKNLRVEDYRFLVKTMVNSGLGEETYGPKNIISGEEEHPKLVDTISELEAVFYDTLNGIFTRLNISPSHVDILVVTVSLSSATPSLASRIINHYNMRSDIKVFNLIGMGCSASVIAIDLVQQLFKTQKNRIAIVVSTESMSAHWYCGRERSMMLSNCLFRVGGCSMLLTNDRARKNQAILKLKCVVRTHLASDDKAYSCCMQVEDDHGYSGFRLNKSLTKVAAQALTKNLRVLLPKVLPLWEIIRYAILKSSSKINLKTGIQHFCVHPGGRAVIDDVGANLGLNEYDLEPSRMTLHRFGNTSSGGLCLGAGFKCNNCVWDVTKDLDRMNVWKDIIEKYPPKKSINPYLDKYARIHAEDMDFATPEDIAKILLGSA
ncbi:hypothetical protein L1887_09274 [Cichorium endivia]|nr:hypothetical protein L1887_09274 [Cichorium endivia]